MAHLPRKRSITLAPAIGMSILFALMLLTGCKTTPLMPPQKSTQTLVGEVKTKIDDSAATNKKISEAVDKVLYYLTVELPTLAPQAATMPATTQATAAAQTAQTLTREQAIDLGQAQAGAVAAGKQATVDDLRVKVLQAEITKLKTADPVKTKLTYATYAAIISGVLLVIGSMAGAGIPLIGGFLVKGGMQIGVGLIAAGILLAGIVQYFDALRLGLLITVGIALVGFVAFWLITHWAVVKEAMSGKPAALIAAVTPAHP